MTISTTDAETGLALREDRRELPVELLVEFCRALVRNHPSGDTIELSLLAAKRQTGVTDEDIARLRAAIFNEAGKSPWPPGFF